MKKYFLLLLPLFLGLVFLLSCKKIKDLLRFDIDYSTEFTIPGNQNILTNLIAIFSPEVSANTEETFKKEGTSVNLVKEIRIKRVKLTITNPAGQTFQFLKSITVYIAKADGSEAKKIAYKDVPTTVGNTLDLDVDNSILLDAYIKADKFKIKTEYTIRDTNPDTKVKTDLTFNVLADPI